LGEDVEEVSESEEALVEGAESDDFVGGMEIAEEQEEVSEMGVVEPEFVEAEESEENVVSEEEVEPEPEEEVEEPEENEPEEEDEPLSIADRFAMQSGFAYDEESEEDEDDDEEVDTSVWLSGDESAEEYIEEETSAEAVEDDSQDEAEEPEEELEEPPVKELSPREHQIHIAQLSNWLAPDSDRFIESIFRGSPEAYEKAIAALSACSGWKAAASYIKEEIFDAFEVELTDPIAADFTDGMQSYFEEFKG
jgi:hypothetical protein